MVALQILVLSAQVRILVPQLSLRGISPNPCACAASAFFQPQSLRDSPFQGQAGSGGASAGRLRCFDVCDISLPLREPLPDFAEAAAIPITVTRQPYVVAEQSVRLGREWSSLTAFQLRRA